jgi:hypothetical protein
MARLAAAADRSAASFRDKGNISETLRVEVSLPILIATSALYIIFNQ